ncbi:peptide deformylase, partial [Streptomyces sp. NPDC059629]|uniref:peptide deformylase n=1 Tax=Streptomyces sp. NPDC059629 TaxID=3346889 RepID=UPI0036A6BA99
TPQVMPSTGGHSHAGPGGQRPHCGTAKKITGGRLVGCSRPRSLRITAETTTLDGTTVTTTYERGSARLIAHEIDHLNELLYLSRMRSGVEPFPVEQHRQTGQSWAYDS